MASNVSEEVQSLKEQIMNYKVGDLHKEPNFFSDAGEGEMDDMQIHIGVFGMTGSGKSSLINTVEKILLGREGETAMVQSSGGEGTVLLEEHLCQMGFTLIDTRGFFAFDSNEETELFRILYAAVRPGQVLERNAEEGEREAGKAGAAGYKIRCKRAISDQVHVVLWVVKGKDVRLKKGEYINKFRFLREQLGKETITIVTAITWDDEMTVAERADAVKLIREATGSIARNTFLISNWLSNCNEYDVERQKVVLKMLLTLLECGERSVKMRQSNRELEKSPMGKSQQAKPRVKTPVQNTEEPSYCTKSHDSSSKDFPWKGQ